MNMFRQLLQKYLTVQQTVVLPNCVQSCGKEKCPQWVIMYHHIKDSDGKEHTEADGRCAMAWIPVLLIELKQTIEKGQSNDKP
jgi:hypothetical protein